MRPISETIEHVKAGELERYEEIVQQYQSYAFGQAFALLGNSHIAEEVVQDAFVEAYRKLETLKEPAAFTGWFRQIVRTSCYRVLRRKQLPTVPLSEVTIREPADSKDPSHSLSRRERDRTVHNAIQHLPDKLRMVTALYFIGSMSQRDIAHYLDLSEPVVKKRLHDARKKLKEYIMTMAESVSTKRTSPEQVSAKVIAELVSRPQLLLIHNHPIRMIVDDIQALLPSYELIDSREVEQQDIYPSIRTDYEAGNAEGYQLDANTMLRTQTSGATLRAIEGRTPPIHLLTAGRVYRAGEENENRLNVFHQLDGVYVGADASPEGLQETMQRIVSGILNNMPTDYSPYDFKWVEDGMEISVQDGSQTWDLGGGGMLKPDMLREAGFDHDTIRGYAFGFGLERMAMLKLGLRNIQDLWKQPYI